MLGKGNRQASGPLDAIGIFASFVQYSFAVGQIDGRIMAMYGGTIYTKTRSGFLAMKAKKQQFSPESRTVFLSLDGKACVAEVVTRLGLSASRVERALRALEAMDTSRSRGAPNRRPRATRQPKSILISRIRRLRPKPPSSRMKGRTKPCGVRHRVRICGKRKNRSPRTSRPMRASFNLECSRSKPAWTRSPAPLLKRKRAWRT